MAVQDFKFDHIRGLQRNCQDSIQDSLPCPEELIEAQSAIRNGQIDEALDMLDESINNASAKDLRVMALVFRSDVFLEKKKYDLAKRDVEEAIILKPKVVEFYWKLSLVEKQRCQLGRAEVALLLGRNLDPGNQTIGRMLHNIRKLDKVLPDVSDRAGTAQEIRKKQNDAGDDFPAGEVAFWLCQPPHVAAILAGDLAKINMLWKPDMVNMCYGRLNQPLIQFVVHGCQRFNEDMSPTNSAKKEEYKAVVDFLYDRGCRLDARDEIGYTAITYACCVKSQPELLEHFLRKGADPLVKSVFGCTPLLNAVNSQSSTEAGLLMKFGADPDEPDNDGVSPNQLAVWNPEMMAVLQKFTAPKAPSKECGKCGKKGKSSRCTKCRVVCYCSKKCQVEHWPDHKKACKKASKSHKKLSIRKSKGKINSVSQLGKTIHYNLNHGKFNHCESKDLEAWQGKMFDVYKDELLKNGNLVVKVQAPTGGAIGEFLIYNESKEFCCTGDAHALDAEDVRAVLKTKGIFGCKGYFWAYMESKNQELVLITDPILPAQPW